jgi:hypothetical protein
MQQPHADSAAPTCSLASLSPATLSPATLLVTTASPATFPAVSRQPRQASEDAALLASLAEWLEPGERVEAVHRPRFLELLRWTVLAWVVFVPWTAFCIDWLSGMGIEPSTTAFAASADSAGQAWQWFRFAALPFLAIGIGGLLVPFWMAWRGRVTRHVVTDRREMTLEAALPTRVVRRRPGRVPSSLHERGERFFDSGSAAIGGLRPVLQSRVSHPLAR